MQAKLALVRVFTSVSKVFRICFNFASLHYAISLKFLSNFFDDRQSPFKKRDEISGESRVAVACGIVTADRHKRSQVTAR